MNKGLLIKTVLLSAAFACVLGVLVYAMFAAQTAASADGSSRSSLFGQFIIDGGVIVWALLLPLSMVMVFAAVDCAVRIRGAVLLPAGVGRKLAQLIRQGAAGPLEEQLRDGRDLVSVAASDAVVRSRGDIDKMERLFEESIGEQAGGLFRRIEWLNLIGNVAPMIGLLGTVLGMIKLFNAIVVAGGQPQPAQFADGISEALVTTFWGLLVAIPALSVYGVLRNRIESLIDAAMNEIEVVLAEVSRNRRQQSPAPATAVEAADTKMGQRIQDVRPRRTRVVREPAKKQS